MEVSAQAPRGVCGRPALRAAGTWRDRLRGFCAAPERRPHAALAGRHRRQHHAYGRLLRRRRRQAHERCRTRRRCGDRRPRRTGAVAASFYSRPVSSGGACSTRCRATSSVSRLWPSVRRKRSISAQFGLDGALARVPRRARRSTAGRLRRTGSPSSVVRSASTRATCDSVRGLAAEGRYRFDGALVVTGIVIDVKDASVLLRLGIRWLFVAK